MHGYSKYDLNLKNYQGKLPHYLQTPGSIIMNTIQLYYDIMEGYKNIIVDMWKHFDIDLLIREYFIWRKETLATDDNDWPYTDLVEKICKSYDIIREHPVELDPIGHPGEGTILRNSHMLRLLKIKTMGVGFDGTKEKLEEILNAIFPNSLRYLVQTVTNGTEHATANVYLIKSVEDESFDEIDEALFSGGYYFLKLLGITLNFYPIEESSLVYDYTIYDDSTNDNINDINGNEYDEGGTV